MNTGQTILTLGALMLLSYTLLNFNGSLSNVDISLSQNRYRMEALSILNTHIQRATQYYFDEASVDTSNGKSLNDFTLPNELGLETNDDGVIDDFDDYNNYTLNDTGGSGIIYKVTFAVNYMKLAGGNLIAHGGRTFHKRMTVSVMDNYNDPLIYKQVNGVKVKDTLKVSFIKSYWFYN